MSPTVPDRMVRRQPGGRLTLG